MEEEPKKLTKAEISKKYRLENKERALEYKREYCLKNKEKIAEYKHEYYLKNKEKITKQSKELRKKNIEVHRERSRIYGRKNSEKNKIRSKEYRANNREECILKGREYYFKNKEITSKKGKEYREKNKEIISQRNKDRRLLKKLKFPTIRTVPRDFSEEEIQNVLNQYKSQNEKFWCPLTDKIYKSHGIWTGAFRRKMSDISLNRFMFLLQEPHYSAFSGKILTENEFSYSETYKGWTGFKKYTLEEIKQRVWTELTDRSTFSTPEYRKKLSEAGKKFNQSEKGIQRRQEKSKKMLDFYKTEEGKKHKMECSKKSSISIKKIIEEGRFTPPITNTWTHWDSKIKFEDGTFIKFRSSWEACFYYSNRHMVYETIRVRGENKTYVSDFFDESTNTMYELKPRNRYNIEIDKMTCLQNYCKETGIKFIWINESNILDYIDVDKLSKDEDNIEQFNKMIKDATIKKIYHDKYFKN